MQHTKTIAFLSVFLLPGFTAAQNAGPVGANSREELTVTARRVEENLQDVPIAVSAFTEQELTRRNLRELEDIALATSGFSFEDYGGGFGVPVVRGGSQLRIQDLDQTTSVFLDGVFIPRQYMVDFGTVGFERVEVIKGPQSALFGRNAFLGAVNYVSGGPTEELEIDIRGTLGSDRRNDISGEISGPILGDYLGGRVIAAYSEFDGTWPNNHPNAGINFDNNGTSGNLGGFENTTIGVNLESSPIEQLQLEFDYYRSERFQEMQASARLESSANDLNCSFDPAFQGGRNRLFCGELPLMFDPLPGGSAPGSTVVVDPRGYFLDVKTDFYHLGADIEITENWGLVYELGRSDSETKAAGAGDRDPVAGSFNPFNPATPVNYFGTTPSGTNEFTSHEIRLEFNQGPWTAFVGYFTSEIDDFASNDLILAPLLDTTPFVIDPVNGPSGVPFFTLSSAATLVDTDAFFGRVGWTSPSGRWNLAAEARYADEEKRLDSDTDTTADGIFRDSWTAFTPRFTVDYRLTDYQMLYASIAKGAKSGGFNDVVFDESQRSFDPDENWTYEIGSKNEWLDGELRLNAAVFYTDWQDLQISSTPLGDIPPGITVLPTVVDNTGGAEIWGIELDGAWLATEMLSFDYAMSLTSAEYSGGSRSLRIANIGACDGITCPANGDISGNKLQRQPAFQASVGAALQGEWSGDWQWYLRGDVAHQSKQYVDELNLATISERTLVNTRFELTRGQWTAALWAQNLFDERYVANSFFLANANGTSYVPIFGQQRTFGLTVSFSL